ncbi:MAG TPA: tRNA lysidine(34) synthetase TilS [Chthoniobacterales bacterium]|nr:tRNA lysidine(34) synthetase TilS [Chthoniobacterales bacterium]
MIRIRNNFLREFPSDGRYLVGVSGGRDSVALLDSLIVAGYKNLTVCHLNHQLRARSSEADARFVEKLAASHHLPIANGTANVRALARKKKLSIETAGREARYKFFAGVAKRTRCRTIFLGHHADDVVETFLINLFRGSGTAGLAGMREVSRRRVDNVDLTVVRPLVATWRSEIDRYVRSRHLKFREDKSNRDPAPLRNRIRLRIIPYLEKSLGRKIRQSLWRAAMIAAEEEAWIEKQVPNSIGSDLAVSSLRDLPAALQRRQILKWLRSRDIGNVGFDVVENVRSLLDCDARIAKINLPQNRHLRRRAKKIFITD